jgi:hypothetical protein
MNRQKENWLVIKSNRKIGRLLVSKLQKSTNLTLFKELNTISVCSNRIDLNSVLFVLNQYQKQKFEVVRFTDEQKLLTVIKRGYYHDYIKRVQSLPLSRLFMWHNDNREGLQSVTPITQRQFNNIIKIN